MAFDHKLLDRVFAALADGTRRQLVHALAQGDRTVSQLAEPFDMSLAAVSKHLKVLERAGLIRRRIDGRTHTCSLNPESLTQALDWIAIYRNFWTQRIDLLSEIIDKENEDHV
ncbi:MAG: winged helix-turn-helix transcriptional regulator [Acidobacteria bacterium]|nr:winged helix-turn-helix transcriptional regulator [Acidobacteriota bacterium]